MKRNCVKEIRDMGISDPEKFLNDINVLAAEVEKEIEAEERLTENKFRLMQEVLDEIDDYALWEESSPFNKGMRALFIAISGKKTTKRESLDPDCDFCFDIEGVKSAGRLLHESGGRPEMIHVLEFAVPRHYHSEISMHWDGIGDWRH
jgi:hypothetical protein